MILFFEERNEKTNNQNNVVQVYNKKCSKTRLLFFQDLLVGRTSRNAAIKHNEEDRGESQSVFALNNPGGAVQKKDKKEKKEKTARVVWTPTSLPRQLTVFLRPRTCRCWFIIITYSHLIAHRIIIYAIIIIKKV